MKRLRIQLIIRPGKLTLNMTIICKIYKAQIQLKTDFFIIFLII
jgi:hypothetical protein